LLNAPVGAAIVNAPDSGTFSGTYDTTKGMCQVTSLTIVSTQPGISGTYTLNPGVLGQVMVPAGMTSMGVVLTGLLSVNNGVGGQGGWSCNSGSVSLLLEQPVGYSATGSGGTCTITAN
jgi:hypothetical protein